MLNIAMEGEIMKIKLYSNLFLQSVMLIALISVLAHYSYTLDREPAYPRLSLPSDFKQPENVDNLEVYGIEFMSMLFKENVFTKEWNYPNTNHRYYTSYHNSEVYGETIPSFIAFYIDSGQGYSNSFHGYFSTMNDKLISNIWESYTYRELIRSTTFLSTCTDKDSDFKCGAYVDEEGDGCYLAVNNGSFSFSVNDVPYCPTKKGFKDKKHQIANYVYDGFMALDIPEEFSWESQKQLHDIVFN